jgi:uncharacterized membrane protein
MSITRPSSLAAGLGLLLPLALILIFLLMPGNEDGRLAAILSGICAQRPSHSLGPPQHAMALEARMYGIFAGVAVAVAVAWLRGGWRRTALPRGWQLVVMLLFVGLMGIDGLNALWLDVAGRSVYAPRNDLRLVSGLLCGLAMASFIAPVVSQALWKRTDNLPLFPTWKDVAIALAALAILAVVSLAGIVPTTALSIVAVIAVLASFWLVNVHFCVLAWDGTADAEVWPDLQRYALVGFAFSVLELAALAFLRGWTESVLGVHWLV